MPEWLHLGSREAKIFGYIKVPERLRLAVEMLKCLVVYQSAREAPSES